MIRHACLAAILLSFCSAIPIQHLLPTSALADDNDYLLPVAFQVSSYTLRLVPYIVEGNFTFDGDVVITLRPLFNVDNVTLHVDRLEIDTSRISVKEVFSGIEVPVDSTEEDLVRNFYVIKLGGNLRAGEEYTVTFNKFTGVLDTDMLGFYRSSYVENGVTRWLGTTQFQATSARRAFPCFDEMMYKATVKLSISRTEDMRAIANMPQDGAPVLDTENTGEVRYWDHFQTTPVMSTYLIAFVVSDFVFLENAAKSFRIFAQAPLISQARYSLSVSPTILDWLGTFTGIPFQLPKMDEVAVPDFDLGAMENWGLVTYRERLILFGDGVSTTRDSQRIATIVAHEFSHQWFGDLVTPVWWSYLWLNEGFATYFEYYAMAEIQPTWRLEDQFVIDNVHPSMSNDASQNSHPMSNDVTSPDSISNVFDFITYEKAGSVLRMLRFVMSADIFRQGLNRYLTEMSYSNADPDNLFSILNAQLHEDNPDMGDVDIKTLMDTWTLQMGFPVVTVTRNYADNTAEITQDRFLMNKIEDHPDTHDYKWQIPLSYTTQAILDFDTTSPTDWLDANNESKIIENLPNNEWVLFNIQESGYYRVNYDAANWDLLRAHLDSDLFEEIHPVNRAQIIDDAFNLARASIGDYSTALGLSLYLARETDYIAWTAAFNVFAFIDNKISNAQEYDIFQQFMLNLLETLYTTVGFDENPDDNHVLKLNRALAIIRACHYGDADCIARSTASLQEWIASPTVNPIKPNLKSGVYCNGIASGGATEWDFLWEQYLASNVATETSIIISSLGCSTDSVTLTAYLQMTINGESAIRRQDTSAVFASVYNNPSGVEVALDFFIENFQEVSQLFGGFGGLGKLIINIANKCNTQQQADKLTQFLTDNAAELEGVADSIVRAIAIVEDNLLWQLTFGQEIIDWIKNNTRINNI